MNPNNFDIENIKRLIAHEIYPKTASRDAYAKTSSDLLSFSQAEKNILIDRITDALNNTTKTFQLDFEDTSGDSVYSYLQNFSSITNNQFIEYSVGLANYLADSHFRTNIPGGFCLIGDGVTTTNIPFFIIIKAELQEVFNIQKNHLKLIKDVFLSPAKDFYKIGLFMKRGDSFVPFMYDDQFTLQKKDLTEYFYGKFLGLTTDKNDRLKTKNFYEDTKSFIESNIDNIKDRLGILKALNVLYREDTSGLISPREFSEKYFENDLKIKFDRKVVESKYPLSFTKDISLIENKLELMRVSMPLTYALAIVGDSLAMEDVDIISEPNIETLENLQPEINSGRINKIVIVRQKIEK
jgi:hypothetical protein